MELIKRQGIRFTDRNPCINRYLSEIKKFPVLDSTEEILIIKIARNGDKAALEALINCNLKLAFKVAKDYYKLNSLTLEELVSLANEGLIRGMNRAVAVWDYTRGFRLMSYVVWSIHQKIQYEILNARSIIYIPDNARIMLKFRNKLIEEYNAENYGIDPVSFQIQEIAQKKERYISDRVMYLREEINYIYEPRTFYSPEDCTNLSAVTEFAQQDLSSLPDYDLDLISMKIDIGRFLNMLSEKEAVVLSLSFGLYSPRIISVFDEKILRDVFGDESIEKKTFGPLNLDDIADLISLTRERVRQINDKAIRRLRKKDKRLDILRKYLG